MLWDYGLNKIVGFIVILIKWMRGGFINVRKIIKVVIFIEFLYKYCYEGCYNFWWELWKRKFGELICIMCFFLLELLLELLGFGLFWCGNKDMGMVMFFWFVILCFGMDVCLLLNFFCIISDICLIRLEWDWVNWDCVFSGILFVFFLFFIFICED